MCRVAPEASLCERGVVSSTPVEVDIFSYANKQLNTPYRPHKTQCCSAHDLTESISLLPFYDKFNSLVRNS